MSDAFTVEIPVRYRDLDPFDHVNNAVYATYLEQARVAYLEDVLDLTEGEFPFVVATLELSYRRPIELGDEPVVSVAVTDLGTSSATIDYEIRVDGDVAATAETTLVHVDPATRESAPIPDAVREAIREYEGLEASA